MASELRSSEIDSHEELYSAFLTSLIGCWLRLASRSGVVCPIRHASSGGGH